jgi:hypothetical protein
MAFELNNVFDSKYNVPGPIMAVNQLTMQICPDDASTTCDPTLPYVALENKQYYNIYITTSNDIPRGCTIQI